MKYTNTLKMVKEFFKNNIEKNIRLSKNITFSIQIINSIPHPLYSLITGKKNLLYIT
jgi:hypothetical protein